MFLAALLFGEDEGFFLEVLCVDISESLEELCADDEEEVLLSSLPICFNKDLVIGAIGQ